MRWNKSIVASVAIATSLIAPSHASAASIFTDAAAFGAAVTGETSYSFPAAISAFAGSSYTVGPATFTAPLMLGSTGAYGTPFLASFGTPLRVTTTGSDIGFYFGSSLGPQTISYTADGLSGVLNVPGGGVSTTFIGFSRLANPIITFTNNLDLDTVRFVAASPSGVPEPSSWALMLAGFGAAGYTLRRRKSATLRVQSS